MANELQRSPLLHIAKDVTDDMINPENMKLLQKYIRDMKMRELSPASIKVYTYDIKAWFRYVCKEQFNQCVKDLNEDDIEEMIFMCKDGGNNTERIKGRMSSIGAFYKFLRRKKEITENPMEFIARPKRGLPVVVQTYLTKEQVEEMKKKLYEQDNLQLRVYGLLSLSTMARVTAISNIMWEQIDFENRVIEDVLEKEGKIVTLFFSEEVLEQLKLLKQEREEKGIDSKYLFISNYGGIKDATSNTLRDWANKIGQMIGIDTFSPHDFRHSMATLLKNAGMKLEEISTLLNHSGTDVTRKHYIKEDKSKIGREKDKYEL